MLAIAEKMPETSDSVPLIGMYLTAVMTLTSCSVILTVMILNFHHRGPFNKPVPKWARSLVLDKLRRLLRMKLEPVICGDYSLSGVNSNGVIRRISTRLDSNDFILSNLNHEAENQVCILVLNFYSVKNSSTRQPNFLGWTRVVVMLR